MARHSNRNIRPPPPRSPHPNHNPRQVLLRHRFLSLDQYFDDKNCGLGLPRLLRFAYLITGSKGDGPQLKRLLQAAYHPRNYYLLHLDLEASDAERLELAKYVKLECDERVSECDGGWNCRFGDRIPISGEPQSWKSRPDSKIGNQKSGILGMSLILISSLIESVEIAAAKLQYTLQHHDHSSGIAEHR